MPVLITSASNAAAYQLARILNIDDVIFADQTPIPVIPGKKNLVLPGASSMSFAHEMLTICLDNDIRAVYPLKIEEIWELSASRQLFSEYGISLLIPSSGWLEINADSQTLSSPGIAVLEDGVLMAGTLPDGNSTSFVETGIFKWSVMNNEIFFSLYLT
jgi:hypothetical protein